MGDDHGARPGAGRVDAECEDRRVGLVEGPHAIDAGYTQPSGELREHPAARGQRGATARLRGQRVGAAPQAELQIRIALVAGDPTAVEHPIGREARQHEAGEAPAGGRHVGSAPLEPEQLAPERPQMRFAGGRRNLPREVVERRRRKHREPERSGARAAPLAHERTERAINRACRGGRRAAHQPRLGEVEIARPTRRIDKRDRARPELRRGAAQALRQFAMRPAVPGSRAAAGRVISEVVSEIVSGAEPAQIDPRERERARGLEQREVEPVLADVYPGDDPVGGAAAASADLAP